MLITIISKAFRNSSDCLCPTGKGRDQDHWQLLKHTATHCKDCACPPCKSQDHWQHTATYCNVLQYSATHCNSSAQLAHRARITITVNTLQYTAIRCNRLQHTATPAHRLPNLQNHDHWMCIHKKFTFLCRGRFDTQIFRFKTRVQNIKKLDHCLEVGSRLVRVERFCPKFFLNPAGPSYSRNTVLQSSHRKEI